MIPALIKKVLGVSLDEMGIGLVNVGSVGFENIACIFDETRLHRRCAIVTDLDATIDGAKRCSEEAKKRGISRKEKLFNLFGSNPYVEAFYAPHTLEVDFANIENNKQFVYSVIKDTYTQADAKNKHIKAIKSGTPAERYDSILTVAEHLHKGWYATLLASKIDPSAIIPMYILYAVAYVAKDVASSDLFWKMVRYSFGTYDLGAEYNEMKLQFTNATTEEIDSLIEDFCSEFPEDMVTVFIKKVGKLNA